MRPTTKLSRRQFLKRGTTAIAAAMTAPYFIPASALGRAGLVPPSERITMGFIGVGTQGGGHLLGGAWTYVAGGYTARKDVQVLAVCDVWRNKRDAAPQRVNQHHQQELGQGNYKSCEAYVDFRQGLGRGDIDGGLIATPPHLHTSL